MYRYCGSNSKNRKNISEILSMYRPNIRPRMMSGRPPGDLQGESSIYNVYSQLVQVLSAFARRARDMNLGGGPVEKLDHPSLYQSLRESAISRSIIRSFLYVKFFCWGTDNRTSSEPRQRSKTSKSAHEFRDSSITPILKKKTWKTGKESCEVRTRPIKGRPEERSIKMGNLDAKGPLTGCQWAIRDAAAERIAFAGRTIANFTPLGGAPTRYETMTSRLCAKSVDEDHYIDQNRRTSDGVASSGNSQHLPQRITEYTSPQGGPSAKSKGDRFVSAKQHLNQANVICGLPAHRQDIANWRISVHLLHKLTVRRFYGTGPFVHIFNLPWRTCPIERNRSDPDENNRHCGRFGEKRIYPQ
ncbi:unnamed protein product [Nesidiocoris tenuis]|uniref:Uncharacterized protein n=1 Tax=Nesidiocoris tenuis TaxID=355587 RepID=A0A6H5HAT5_9HEMI|nr:unnamed protein product [Nesidiocoris tenuis]